MATSTLDGLPGSRILRTGTINGRVAGVDRRIREALRELDDLLAMPLFAPPQVVVSETSYEVEASEDADAAMAAVAKAAVGPSDSSGTAKAGGGSPKTPAPTGLDLDATLPLPLQPRRPGDSNEWEPNTLAKVLDANKGKSGVDVVSLSSVIADDAELSQLADKFESLLAERWWELPFNVRVVLGREYPAIRAYLTLFGARVRRISTASGLVSFVAKNLFGAARIVDYGTISAARDWIHFKNLKIDFRDDDDDVIAELRAANLSCSEDAFLPAVERVVKRSLSDTGNSGSKRIGKLVDVHKSLFPEHIRATLIEYLKRAPVKIVSANVQSYIPLYVQQITGGIDVVDQEPTRQSSDQDFAVDFFTEDKELVEISRSSVKAAAQLYYTMTLGDELQVFDVVNYFTHKYLVGRGFQISDPKLRRDLQMYVFSNQFTVTDRTSNTTRLVDRTQPAERMMFYRQVFNHGGGQITEDVIVNDEFSRLWKVLMLESAKYLERIQISPHPDTRVSRQNVMQAVEDLQYNLSIHCTGMATVMTPLIYDELNFVTRRILMHDEVRKQVAPSGGSWWKVVETLYEGMKRVRPRATALNNKARLGHSIIRKIAEYDPEPFEQDDNFFPFISDVEAFISTQSILQEHLTDSLKEDLADEDMAEDEMPDHETGRMLAPVNNGRAAPSAPPPSGEWDF